MKIEIGDLILEMPTEKNNLFYKHACKNNGIISILFVAKIFDNKLEGPQILWDNISENIPKARTSYFKGSISNWINDKNKSWNNKVIKTKKSA